MRNFLFSLDEVYREINQLFEYAYLSTGEYINIISDLIYRIRLASYAESNLMNYVDEIKYKYNEYCAIVSNLIFSIGLNIISCFRQMGFYCNGLHNVRLVRAIDQKTLLLELGV